MKHSIFIATILLVCATDFAFAQTDEFPPMSNTMVYADLGGWFVTGLASLNMERKIRSNEKNTWYARFGIGGGEYDGDGGTGILAGATFLKGRDNNHFEITSGLFVGSYTDLQDELFVLPILDFGYRYQQAEGGLLLKAKIGILGFGVGVGHAF